MGCSCDQLGDQPSDLGASAVTWPRPGLDWLDLAALGALAGSIDPPRATFRALVGSIWLPRAPLGVDFAAHGQCFRRFRCTGAVFCQGRPGCLDLVAMCGPGRPGCLNMTALDAPGRFGWLDLAALDAPGRPGWLDLAAQVALGRLGWLHLAALVAPGRADWLDLGTLCAPGRPGWLDLAACLPRCCLRDAVACSIWLLWSLLAALAGY